jgi:hypothetical protein
MLLQHERGETSGRGFQLANRLKWSRQWGPLQFGPDLNHSYFRARTKGGVTLIFGNPDVITTGPGTNTDATATFANGAVAAFAESAAIDTAGNFIAFHYILNTNGDHNISEIDYTGHGHFNNKEEFTVDQKFFASLTFQYKLASQPIDLYVGGQLLRQDEQLTDIYACVSAGAKGSAPEPGTKSKPAEAGLNRLREPHRVREIGPRC